MAPRQAAMQAICASIGSIAIPARSLVATSRPYNSAASTSNGVDERQTIIWRAVGGIGRGSLVEPDRYSSTPAAQARPSAIAQTISD
jgi:hypothetical protein